MTPATVAGVTEVRSGGPQGAGREHIIERIVRWVELYGEPPRLADWNPGQAKATGQLWRIDRYRAGDPETGARWPSANAARRPFGGSLEAAIRAAGFVPARRGPKPRRDVDLVRVDQAALTPDQRATVDAALARARDAQREAAALEERVRRAGERIVRLEDALAGARRENGRLRRRSGRPTVAGAAHRAGDELARAHEQAAEARRTAARLAALLERAEATIAALSADRTGASCPRRLTAAELAALRAAGPAGPKVLATALEQLARARRTGNPTALDAALTAVAGAAVAWKEHL